MEKLKILITGACGGLGSALSRQLAGQGANLLLLDKTAKGLDAISDQICEMGLDAPGTCTLDLAKSGPEAYESLCDLLQREYGGLDVFIHCAAVFQGLQPLDHVDYQDWLECMQVNLHSAWMIASSCMPLLKAADKGKVVLIQESEAVTASAYWGAYGISKAALNSLGQILQEELDGTSVELIQCSPGPMRTALRARAYLAEDPQTLQDPESAAESIARQIQ